VEAIARIKLPSRSTEDVLAWHAEKTGLFTVRSAYNLALKLKHGETMQSSSSSPEGERKLWSNIWGVDIPPKVKIFAWKLSKNILPTKHNKLKRKQEVEDIYDICGMEQETCFHAVVSCCRASDLRQVM